MFHSLLTLVLVRRWHARAPQVSYIEVMSMVRARRVVVGLGVVMLAGGCGGARTELGEPDADGAAPAVSEPSRPALADGDSQRPTAPACSARLAGTLATQEDLDALEGCELVDGDLSIHALPGLDTTPLLSLRRVTGELSISGNGDNDPRALDGLAQLESVGALTLANLYLTDLSALRRLRSIQVEPDENAEATHSLPGSLAISGCGGLTSLAGLEGLERVEMIQLTGSPELTELSGLDGLQTLGRLLVSDCPLVDLNGLAGIELGGLHVQRTAVRDLSGLRLRGGVVGGGLALYENPDLASLGGWRPPADLYDVTLSGNGALRSLNGLEAITTLTQLVIENEAELASLAGLEGLRRVEHARLVGNPLLQRLAPLAGAGEIVDLSLEANGSLAELAAANVRHVHLQGLPALTTLSGVGTATLHSLEVEDVPLVDLDGLEPATSLESLSLVAMPSLTSLAGLSSGGLLALSIDRSPSFVDLDALSGVTALRELELVLTGVQNLDSLAGLRRVGLLRLFGNGSLEQIDAIGAVSTIGSLEVYDNPVLRRLPAFAGWLAAPAEADAPLSSISVGGNALLEELGPWPMARLAALLVGGNAGLRQLSFPELQSVEQIEIHGNAQLTSVALPSLVRGQSVVIRDNAQLDAGALAPLSSRPELGSVRIVSNLGGPSRFSPCPWPNDGVCDELAGDCAPETDVADCR